ncbi:hypothetical protein DICPUDRAFT_24824, partial [Dictyostelium purpureum]
QSGEHDSRCSICLDDFIKDQHIKRLPKCSHFYHAECIDEWLTSSKTCPLCKTEL